MDNAYQQSSEFHELLEACKLGLAVAEEWIRSELEGTSQLKSALAELKPVRDAIAKAEGK